MFGHLIGNSNVVVKGGDLSCVLQLGVPRVSNLYSSVEKSWSLREISDCCV